MTMEIDGGFVLVFVLVFIAVLLAVLQINNENRFNDWTSQCRDQGGLVTFYSQNISYSHYECIKDGQIILHQE